MSLQEDGFAKTLYISQASFPTKIYMNVYQNHLSLITDIKMYSKQYICNCCGKLSTRMLDSKRHQYKCDGTVKHVFLGGVNKNKKSVFEDLEEGITVSDELKVEKWFACFDYEAYQIDFDSRVDEVDESQEGTSWNKVHVPALSRLEEEMVEAPVDLDDLMDGNVEWDVDESGQPTSSLLKELKKCYGRLERYCKSCRFPVLILLVMILS